jgi:alkaline phosphatase D
MPLRSVSRPNGASLRLYDRFSFGDLVEIAVLDGRQYRSREACYGKPKKGGGHVESPESCPELLDPARSMLGQEQEAWLTDGLTRSQAAWNVLAQDVMMTRFRERTPDGHAGVWTDDWNGYPANRTRLLRHIHAAKVKNPVVFGGDLHSFFANDLALVFDDPKSPTVATELIGTSITSHPPPFELFQGFVAESPHVRFFDNRQRGYLSTDLARERMTARCRVVSDVRDPKATVSTLASFVVESGKPGVTRA